MKNLKNYIKNYINESVWDIEDNIEDDNKEFVLNEIKKFIADNYRRINIDSCEFVFDENKEKFVVGYAGDLKLNDSTESIVNDLFEWGTVKGWFDCSKSPITSLKGAPKTVGGNFFLF